MLVKFMGWLLIISGVIFLIKPEALRNKLVKKGIKRLKKTLFLITFTVAILFITTALKMQGIMSKVILVFGIIGIIKAFLFLKEKTGQKMLDLAINMPIICFRIGGIFYIIIGVIMLRG